MFLAGNADTWETGMQVVDIYQSMLIHYNLEGEVIDIESANDKDLRLKRSYFLLEDKIVL